MIKIKLWFEVSVSRMIEKNQRLLYVVSGAMVRKLILFILLPNPRHKRVQFQGIILRITFTLYHGNSNNCYQRS